MFRRVSLASFSWCKALPYPKPGRRAVNSAASIGISQISTQKPSFEMATSREMKLKPWLDRKRIIFDITHKLASAAINGLSGAPLRKSEEGLELLISVIDRYTGPKILKKLHQDSEMLAGLNANAYANLDLSQNHTERSRLECVYKTFSQFSRKLSITPHHSKMYELETLAYKLPMLLCQLNIYERFVPQKRFKRSLSDKFLARINHWVDVKQRNVKIGLRIFDQLQTQVPQNLEKEIENLVKTKKDQSPDIKKKDVIAAQKKPKLAKPKYHEVKGNWWRR